MNLRKTLITLCILALLGLGLVVGARPAWQKYKSWRAASLLADSARFEQEGSLVVAFQKAQAASMLDRESLGAGRCLARLATQVRHPNAPDFWESVVSHEASTSDDYASAIEAATSLRRNDKATAWMDRWRRRFPSETGPVRQRVEIMLLAARGDLAACRESIARLRTATGGIVPPAVSLIEARIVLALDKASGTTRAGELFLEAGSAPTADGLQSLILATTFADLPKDTRLDAARRLLSHPAARLPQHILARLTEVRNGIEASRKRISALEAKLK
jgi:hypothetical protein